MLDWVGGAAAFRGEDEEDDERGAEGEEERAAAGDEPEDAGESAPGGGWRAWGSSALRAVAQLDGAAVAQLARSTLEVVQNDVLEFSQAVREDARDLAAVGSSTVQTVVLPELRAKSVALKETLSDVAAGGLGEASSSLLANLVSLRDTILYENDANVAPSRRRAQPRGGDSGGAGSRGRGDARPSLATRVAAMQRDSATYCSQPADSSAFEAFMATFSVEERAGEVTHILGGNAFMAELHSRIVPVVVDEPTFWARYFFHLHQLTQQEQQPAGGGGEAGQCTDAQPTTTETSVPEPSPAPQEAPTLDTADAEPSAAEQTPGDTATETAPAAPTDEQQPPEQQAAPPGGRASAGSVSSGGGRDDESNTSSSWTEVEEPSHSGAAVAASAEPAGNPPPAAAPDPPVVDPPADSTPSPEPATPQGSGVKKAVEGDTPSPSPWPKGAAAADEEDDLDEDWGLS